MKQKTRKADDGNRKLTSSQGETKQNKEGKKEGPKGPGQRPQKKDATDTTMAKETKGSNIQEQTPVKAKEGNETTETTTTPNQQDECKAK